MIEKSYPICMEIAGATALWSRPDTGVCPVSYPAPTYSAVKALFEAVLWGPAVEIVPQKVELCAPIQWHNYATNYGGPLKENGKPNFQLFATVLTDVCYRIYADVRINRQKDKLPEKARQWDKKTTSPGHAYQAMFNRRLKRGESFDNLFLGWREFTPSYVGEFRPDTTVCSDMPDIFIPSMLREVFSGGYASVPSPVYDVNLTIHGGVLIYPERGGV